MSSGMSAYLEAKILDHVLGGTTYTPPATVYFALSTAAFDPSATGSAMSEATGTAYARQAQTNNTTNFPNATGSNPAVKSTGTTVDWGTAGSSWGTIQSVYILDASSAGNVLYGGDLPAPSPVGSGSGFAVPSGQGTVTQK